MKILSNIINVINAIVVILFWFIVIMRFAFGVEVIFTKFATNFLVGYACFLTIYSIVRGVIKRREENKKTEEIRKSFKDALDNKKNNL